jgi:uncharacterized protein DUF4430
MPRPVPDAVAGAVMLLLAAGVIAGCGLGAGSTPANVTLTVTRGFGGRVLRQANAPKVVGQETVMQLLMRNARVSTRFGGGFVQSIDGVAGGHVGGHPVDWFYYVNGMQADKGAAETVLHAGDRVWWDLHDWSATASVPAVVGSYPQPFLSGSGGKRFPVTLYCVPTVSDACQTVTARLKALGVNASRGALGTDEPVTLRVIVGPWPAARADAAAIQVQAGPQAGGVYANFTAHGTSLSLLGPGGAVARTLTGSVGLVASTRLPGEAPTWLVTGTDAAGTRAAAQLLSAAALEGHFAVAVSGGKLQAVPVGGP